MQFKIIQPKTLNFFLSYQTKEEEFFYIPQYQLYIISKLENNEYLLVFILDKKLVVDKFCNEIFDKSSISIIKEDIPWRGFKTNFIFALMPIECTKGLVAPALIVTIPPGDAMFHWDQIAYMIFTENLYKYLNWVKDSLKINFLY